MPDLTDREIADALDNAKIVFGLEAQGHIPTIEAMRADGKSWYEVGRKIGWEPDTAERHYGAWCARKLRETRIALITAEELARTHGEAADGAAKELRVLRERIGALAEEWDSTVSISMDETRIGLLKKCAARLRQIGENR